MRKKIVWLFALVLAFGATLMWQKQKPTDKLLIENVEALSNPDISGANCTGYRDWANSGGVLSKKREFYDCKCVLRSGYKPSGNCN